MSIESHEQKVAYIRSQREDLFEIMRSEAAQSLDISLGYPQISPIHRPLIQIQRGAYCTGLDFPHTIDQQPGQERLADFFGFDRNTLILPSASEAIATAVSNFTLPGDQVLTFHPAWGVYREIITLAGDGGREAVSARGFDYLSFDRVFAENPKIKVIILNTPRNPDMYIPNEEFLLNLANAADKHGVTVIYDEVFCFYDGDTQVLGTGNTNRIVREFPRSRSHVIIRDTGKILPHPFPKIAMMSISDEALQRGGARLLAKEGTQHFSDPAKLDLFVLGKVLNSAEFLTYLSDLKRLIAFNQFILACNIPGARVNMNGPFALVDITDLGLHRQHLELRILQYGLKAMIISEWKHYLRIPLVLESGQFSKNLWTLARKLESMKIGRDHENELYKARFDIYPF